MEKKLKTEMDSLSPPQMVAGRSGGTAAAALNSITPCAACKLLRRRCVEECPFSPYFSPHEPHKFAAVHKVFGASNVSKLLMEVPERERTDAANSLVYEANVRLRDPVYGCMGAISGLQQQLQFLQSELNAVRAELLKFKYTQLVNNCALISVTSSTTTDHHQTAAAAAAIINSMAVGGISAVVEQPQAPPTPPPSSVMPLSSSTSPSATSLFATSSNMASFNSHHVLTNSNNNNNISFFQ